MAYTVEDLLERQRRRWMKPNAHLYMRSDASRFMRPNAERFHGPNLARRNPYFAAQDAQHTLGRSGIALPDRQVLKRPACCSIGRTHSFAILSACVLVGNRRPCDTRIAWRAYLFRRSSSEALYMIIASRTLKVHTDTGIMDVPIRVFRPEKTNEDSWSCRYEIDWPNRKWTMAAFGIDGIQAILNAFQMIGAEIYTSDFHKARSLSFETPGHGYGFPVPSSLRHLLEGDDSEFS